MKCPSCGHENPESAVHCSDCRVPLHPSLDDRTMNGRPDATAQGASQPSRAESNTNVSSMVRTPSGHSASQSRSSSGGSGGRSRVLEPGDELGPRFLINALLGEGGMGRVYKATDLQLGREIAIKVLLSELTSDPQVIQRFKSELLLASRISHRNILRIQGLRFANSTTPGRTAKFVFRNAAQSPGRKYDDRHPLNVSAQESRNPAYRFQSL